MTRSGDAAARQALVPCGRGETVHAGPEGPAYSSDLEVIMPFGSFLDSLPSMLFASAHVLFLLVGVWVARKVSEARAPFASVIWLYAVSQVVFLAFFGGLITMKMAVLVEQMLMVVTMAAIAITITIKK